MSRIEKRQAFLIANGNFPKEAKLPPLLGPPNDVRNLARVLSDDELGSYAVSTFIDQEHHGILPELESRLIAAKSDDQILLYYSGHGKLDERGELYLTTRDTRLPALLSTSIPATALKKLFDRSPARRKVLILDCCFSGSAARSWVVKSTVSDQVQLQLKQMGRGTGLHLLTSSSEFEPSLERETNVDGEMMGIFTRVLVEGIETGLADENKDGRITIEELRKYMQARLVDQVPFYWSFEAKGEIDIAFSRHTCRFDPSEQLLQTLKSLSPELIKALNGSVGQKAREAVHELTQILAKHGDSLGGSISQELRSFVESAKVGAVGKTADHARMRQVKLRELTPDELILGRLLVSEGFLTKDQLRKAIEVQKKLGAPLEDVLIQQGFISHTNLLAVLSDVFQHGLINLDDFQVAPSTIALIPLELALLAQAIPVAVTKDSKLLVAMRNPLDEDRVEDLRASSGHAIVPLVTSRACLMNAFRKYYGVTVVSGRSGKGLASPTP